MGDLVALQHAWNRTHRETPIPDRPEADIVAFAESVRSSLPAKSPVLDAGCGRGRHTAYLSTLGFTVYGCDLSIAALQIAQSRMRQTGLAASFQVSRLDRLPYADNIFAAALCVHVLPYNLQDSIVGSIDEMRRVLQPGGWLYLDLLDREDAKYGCGQKLEEHTFLEPSGIPVHFSSRHEVDELMQGFRLERVMHLELKPLSARARVGWTAWAVKNGEEHRIAARR